MPTFNSSRPPLDVEEPYVDEPWTPTAYTTFKLLLSARLCAAIWSNISDCDEVFNYWEPVHYLLHGSGFQTWEYSPAYAIRSYAYIWLHVFPLKIYATFLQAHKVTSVLGVGYMHKSVIKVGHFQFYIS